MGPTILSGMLFTACESAPSRYSSQALSAPTVVPETLVLPLAGPLEGPRAGPRPAATVEPGLVPDPATIQEPADALVTTPTLETGSSGSGLPTWPREWVNAWVPLESWGRLNGLGKPIQLSNGTEAVYQLQTSNGLVLVKMGSHTANIRGLEYGLGFAPRLIRGLPYIHSIDAQKTLQALLSVLWPLPLKTRTIVIDPGHGGRDSGTRSVATHTPEKDYTLDWALRLKERLAASHWIVVLTRTNDAEVALAERVAVADRVGADLFVSLHLNSGGPNHQLSGVETYCLTPTGMPSSLLREYEDDPREAHPNNHFDDLNVQLATRLHRSILQTTGANDRGVRRARFMAVLRGQQRPAVLIEGGYLTHSEEARRLADPAYRQLLADAVAKALTE
jgi:N-acetylmuramoyl-L-alanine amidase